MLVWQTQPHSIHAGAICPIKGASPGYASTKPHYTKPDLRGHMLAIPYQQWIEWLQAECQEQAMQAVLGCCIPLRNIP
jgi:hypothetical protein